MVPARSSCCARRALGLVLIIRPLDGTDAAARLIGAGVMLLGIDFVLDAVSSPRRIPSGFNGVVWIGIGFGAIVWPDPTIRGLAIVVGVGLVATGIVEIASAIVRAGPGRGFLVLGGVSSTLFGVAALAWPTITVLVLSIVTGARLVVAGVLGWIRRRDAVVGDDDPATSLVGWRRGARYAVGVIGVAVGVIAVVVSVAVNRAQPDGPGAFYSAPEVLPGPPGTLIRSEIVSPFLDGAIAHRVLYVTSGSDGQPITSSGLVIVPTGPVPTGGRPVMAFTHGTVGIARNCALSLLPGDTYGPAIPGIRDFLDAGFVVAATDYAGLGSEATTGYLVGSSQAFSTLDSVRAAIAMPETGASNRFAAFGESQGGQAALFTGQYAAEYAPELELVGIAAAAPATDLTALFRATREPPSAMCSPSYALKSWQQFYDIDLDDIVTDQAIPVIDRIAELCIQNTQQMIAVVPEAELLKISFSRTHRGTSNPGRRSSRTTAPGRRSSTLPS